MNFERILAFALISFSLIFTNLSASAADSTQDVEARIMALEARFLSMQNDYD